MESELKATLSSAKARGDKDGATIGEALEGAVAPASESTTDK